MFAIVDILGFQEKVEKGSKLRVPLMDGNEGDVVTFDKVLLVAKSDSDITIGTPHVSGATVKAKIVRFGKTDKVRVLKFKRRKRYLKIGSHRQRYTDIEVTDVA